ncbi:MAG: uL15m family ribosomal protein [Candidatus Aenigmatarchaeota archaeon]
MVVRKEKKHRKFRGRRTYHGSHKKRRGKGSRGGRGMAGMHKQKWTYTVKYAPNHFGKIGFKRPKEVFRKPKSINLGELEKIIESKEISEKEGDLVKVNVLKLGYDKVLGSGKISKPLIVEAKFFSKNAIEKIERAGGKAKFLS